MATKTTNKTTSTRTRNTSKRKTTTTKKNQEVEKPVAKKALRIPPDTMLTVVSNCLCPLVYTSKRLTGYTIEWESFGSIQYMEFQEVVAMHNTDLRFFSDNWIVIEPTDDFTSDQIYEALHVSKYYKHYVSPDTIDNLFTLDADEIKDEVSKFSDGMKDTVKSYSDTLKSEGDLDSISKIEALDEALGIKKE